MSELSEKMEQHRPSPGLAARATRARLETEWGFRGISDDGQTIWMRRMGGGLDVWKRISGAGSQALFELQTD